MYKKKSGIIGIIITVIILILLVFFSNLKLESFSFVENAFSTIIMPIQTGYTYLKNKVTGNSNFFDNMDGLKAENEELKTKNSNLEQELRKRNIKRIFRIN